MFMNFSYAVYFWYCTYSIVAVLSHIQIALNTALKVNSIVFFRSFSSIIYLIKFEFKTQKWVSFWQALNIRHHRSDTKVTMKLSRLQTKIEKKIVYENVFIYFYLCCCDIAITWLEINYITFKSIFIVVLIFFFHQIVWFFGALNVIIRYKIDMKILAFSFVLKQKKCFCLDYLQDLDTL